MSNKKIFILEDDINILYGLASQLSADNFIVESSEGEEDISLLLDNIRTFSPDYIILDLILPKLDGFEVLKKIREDSEMSEVPIFIFTDVSDEDSKQRSFGLGASQYFLKDEFDVYGFAQKIRKIIENELNSSDLIDLND